MSTDNTPSTLAAVYVSTTLLKPWAKNPRKNDLAVQSVVKSIKRFGFGAPILVRQATNEIIAGHTRLKAAIKLGLAEVPVRYLDLSEAEAHALALADNRINQIAEWDDEALAEMLRDLVEDEISLEGLGWTDDELKKMLASSEAEPAELSALREGLIYRVVIDVSDEAAQSVLIERLEREGYKCAPLIS